MPNETLPADIAAGITALDQAAYDQGRCSVDADETDETLDRLDTAIDVAAAARATLEAAILRHLAGRAEGETVLSASAGVAA